MAAIEKRTTETGETCYRVKVRLKGHPAQTATFRRLTDARKWGVQTEAAIRERRFFKTAEAQKHTLADLVDRYIREMPQIKPAEVAKRTQQLIWWKERIGAYTLADTTPALIAEGRDKLRNIVNRRGQANSPANVNRYLAALSHAFTVAVKEWGWLEDNPLRKVSKLKEPRGRVRFLSDQERAALLEACQESTNRHLYPVVILALSTGMRAGEIMKLTWPDVDLEQGRIILHETKNGERRLVPLAGKALELLRQHNKVRRLDTNLLFPGNARRRSAGQKQSDKPLPPNPAELRAPWLVALDKAEISDFRFHDLRHSAASYLAMNGASLAEIAEVLGHKTLQMVKRYAHLSEAHTAGVVERMNAAIFGEGG